VRQSRSRSQALVVFGVAAVIAGGCVKPNSPGVSIAQLKADIVFGVKEPAPPATPANFDIVAPQAFFDSAVDEETFDEKVLEIPSLTPIPQSSPPVDDCPPAALTAFPKDTAEVTVKGMPVEGVYRFKRTITVTPTGGTPISNVGFEQHAIRNVKQTPGKPYEFTYEVVQPNILEPGFTTITYYRVNSNPTVIQSVNRGGTTVGVVPTPGVEKYVTPPTDEPGIFVDKIEKKNANGGTESTFDPMQKVKYLPLEEGVLKAGQTMDTVGIDAKNGQAIRHEGTVLRKTRVDACGEIVEGWLVESLQTRTADNNNPTAAGGAVQRKYFYNIATQYGAYFIGEAIDMTVGLGRITIDLSLANPKPQPLPDSLK
jgi:hypothetical protein